jgi:hypothetical protein
LERHYTSEARSPLSLHYVPALDGSGVATLVWFERSDVRWEGTPAMFRASPIATRSHCGRCGTPMALSYDDRTTIALAAGTLDDPEQVTPVHNYGAESGISWAGLVGELPEKETKESW